MGATLTPHPPTQSPGIPSSQCPGHIPRRRGRQRFPWRSCGVRRGGSGEGTPPHRPLSIEDSSPFGVPARD